MAARSNRHATPTRVPGAGRAEAAPPLTLPEAIPVEPEQPPGPSLDAFPVVGIGASAGGLGAFEAFFSGMPAGIEPGMAFVLVQHLAPDHESILTELIQRCTRMKVLQVENGMAVRPNCVYIIPPNRAMALQGGALQLTEPAFPHGLRLPIDFFFRSLAQAKGERAIGIVLSGTGSDGTLGVRAIKGEGGMIMVQSFDSAEYAGMPRSASTTGLVDYELAPADMPAKLMAYAAHPFPAPHEEGTPFVLGTKTENALKRVFVQLQAQTGHDFAYYKPSTIQRRIQRRLAILQIPTLAAYAAYLEQTPAEVEALFRDLLIGVTHFFRDPEAFKALEEQVLPRLLAAKSGKVGLRLWSPGCSTGEEPYSLAILLQERLEATRQNLKIQIFATDIDSQAIHTARTGLYPASIAADLLPERLARFFSPLADGTAYQINKVIRDMVVFSEQDVIKDPPFSHLDLISCRNLLIYLGRDLQKRLIPLFHYALNPGGFLFQGTAESVGEFADLFIGLDRKWKLYQRKDGDHAMHRESLRRLFAPMAVAGPVGRPTVPATAAASRTPLQELTERALLQQIAPAGALVNGQGDILYLHGSTSPYLELSPGEPGLHNILKMARTGLRRDLTTALRKAVVTHEIVRCPGLRIKTGNEFTDVNLTLRPVPEALALKAGAPLFLVVLEEPAPPALETCGPPPRGRIESLEIHALQRELLAKEDYLKASREELETSNEELKSSNEEMQSVNEELQSTNEEMETSKEELQSVNEELATVNSELLTKVADLTRANNDMNNLLAGTGIGTVFVDHQLRILRFTPAVTQIINLIPSDSGRPVGHLVSNLVGYDRLVLDIQAVLDTLMAKEREVQTLEGKWYNMSIQLYRTLDNVIEGAVITFVNITQMKRAEAALQANENLFRQMVSIMPHLVWTCRPDGLCMHLSAQWVDFTGVPEAEQLGLRWLDQVHPEDRTPVMAAWNLVLGSGEPFRTWFRLRHHSGTYHPFDTRALALRDETGQVVKWFGISTELQGRPQRRARAGNPPPRKERAEHHDQAQG